MFRYFRLWRARSRYARAWRAADWRTAIEAGEILVKEMPNDHEVLNNLGIALLEAGELTRAEASFRRAIELRENAIHWNNLGRVLLQKGQHAEAKAAFQRATELDPSDPLPRYNLTVYLRTVGQEEEAAEELRRFVSAFPHHAAGQNDLGCLADARGEREQALTCFTSSIELAPEYLPARLNLIRLLCDLNRHSDATPHLQVLAACGMHVRVKATDLVVEIDLNGQSFYRGSRKKG